MAVDLDGTVLASCDDSWAEPVTYIPAAGAPTVTVGVFDPAYNKVVVVDGLPVTQVMPVLGVRLSNLASVMPLQNDKLSVRGSTYVVRDVQPDGHGHVRLELNWVSTP